MSHKKQVIEEEVLENEMSDLQEEIKELEQKEEQFKQKTSDNEIEKLKKENAEIKDSLARIQADYQNFKFRTERDKSDTVFFAKYSILKNILGAIDDLERILKNTPESEKQTAIYKGNEALKQKLDKTLTDLGVIAFESIGQEVNPDKHEVMTQIPSQTPGVIVDEFEKGYMLGDRVLRVAKVIVGS